MNGAKTIKLSDYKPFPFLLEKVEMQFVLLDHATVVSTKIWMKPNPENPGGPLVLDGQELKLLDASIDGQKIPKNALNLTDEGLSVAVPDGPFVWECTTEIDPANNTSLEGLYMTQGMFCTQCEAEGFRKITYFPDRPDVMTTFKVRIESALPVLLSNGNPTASGEGWAEWDDPWPKPAYLFALVAGDLVSLDDKFTTCSGRAVDLKIYVRPGDENKCAYAMDSLKRSMQWDEEKYGREYDLDLFNIVAVDDFNAGAMENKGLNIFNSSLVLASPESATDTDYELIESVIAHEYFHNWTGNRITCRDWFQLCLKEGLTVYRDTQFTSDMRDQSVKRIEDAKGLRTYQYREDAGPLAHPPRPKEYVEINNFYTSTVYVKGAEVVGMLHTLVGPDDYRKSLDLYFERHDGQACTIEDWIKVFEDSTGRDLSQFKLWYTSAGTPIITAVESWEHGVFNLTLSQETPATPGEQTKAPRHIPVAVGLLYPDGSEAVKTKILELTGAIQTFSFSKLRERPVASILRGFSAPVILKHNTDVDFLLAHDTDPFNKWEAGHKIASGILRDLVDGNTEINPGFLSAMASLAKNENLDPAFRALALSLPSEEAINADIFANGGTPDPIKTHNARKALNGAMASILADDLPELYAAQKVAGAYSPDAKAAGKRALRARFLELITALDPLAIAARQQYTKADNMTEQLGALTLLVQAGKAEDALADFYKQWSHVKLVVDKWFAVQAGSTPPEHAVETVIRLTEHPDFEWKNPNRFRSVIGGFVAQNLAGFHAESGAGYDFFVNWIIRLDPINPQIAAGMAKVMSNWQQFSQDRQAQMKTAFQRLQETGNLSKDTTEIVALILDGAN